MAFDYNRLRLDQLQRLKEVGGDFNQLSLDELQEFKESQEEVGDLSAGASIAESNIRTGVAGIASLLGFDEFAKGQLEEAQKESEELQARYTRDVPTFDSIQDIGDFGEYIKETAATSLLPTGIGLAGGVIGGIAGTAIAGPAGTVPGAIAGATAFGTPFFTGSNINRQMEELGLSFEDTNKAKALGVAVGQAALDSVIGRVFGIFGRGAPQEIAKYAAPTLRGRALKVGKKAGEGAIIEGITEPAQQALEIIQANPDKFFDMPPEIRAELTEAAIAGGLLGGILGGVSAPFSSDPTSQAKEDLDKHMKELGREVSARQTVINEYEAGQQGFLPAPMARGATEVGGTITQPSIEGAPPAPQLDEKKSLIKQLGYFQIEADAAARQGDLKKQAKIENFEIPRLQKKIAELDAKEELAAQEAQTEQRLQAAVETFQKQQRQMPLVVEPEIESRNKIDRDPVVETGQLTEEEAVGLSGTVEKARENQVGLSKRRIDETAEDFELEAPEGVAPPPFRPFALRENDPFSKAFATNPELGDLYQELIDLESAPQKKAFPINAKKKQIRDLLKQAGESDEVAEQIVNDTPAQKQEILRLSQAAVEQEAEQAREEATKFIDEIAPDGIGVDEKRTFDQQVERVRKMIGRRLRKLGLGDIDVALDETTSAGREGSMATRGGRFIMNLAYKYIRPGMTDKEVYAVLSQVMNHEMIHAMKQMGLFTAKEWASLTQAVRSQRYVDNNGNVRKFSYFDRAGALYNKPELAEQGGYESLEAMQEEEAIAELFRDFRVQKKRDQMLKDNRSGLKKIFDKIVRFFKGIAEDAHKEAKDIFEAIEAGEVGRRERISANAESETVRESQIRRDVKKPEPDLPIKTDVRGLRYQDVVEETEDGAVDRRRYLDTTRPEADDVTSPSREALGGKVYNAYYNNVAKYQRGWPEDSMVALQAALKGYPRGFSATRINVPNPNAFGEDTYGSVIEHTNDLLHRAFGQNHGSEFYPVDNAVEKARRMLDYMQGYGDFPTYKDVVANEFRGHAEAFGMTVEEYSEYLTPYINNFIDAHQSIPVYNDVQIMLNEATIALGQLDFEKARGNLLAFLNSVNAGEEAYFDAIQPAMVDAEGNPVNLKRKTVHRAAERAGIDDAKGTERFSTLDAATDWYKNSVEKDQVYHGTLAMYPAFERQFRDIGFHFGTEIQAYDRLNELGRFQEDEPKVLFPRFIKARINLTKPLMVPRDPIAWNSPSDVFGVILSGVYDVGSDVNQASRVVSAIQKQVGKKFESFQGRVAPHPDMTIDHIRDAMKSLGYDGIIYINSVEGNQGEMRRFMPDSRNQSFIVFEPSQIWVEESEDLVFADIPTLETKPDYREIFDSQSFTENELARAEFDKSVDELIALQEGAIGLTLRENTTRRANRLGQISVEERNQILRQIGTVADNPDLRAERRFWAPVTLEFGIDLPFTSGETRRPEMFDIEYSLRGIRDNDAAPPMSADEIDTLIDALSDHMSQALDVEGISADKMRGIEDYTNAMSTALENLKYISFIDPETIADADRIKIQPTLGVQEKLTERMSRIDPPKINKDGTIVGSPPGARTVAARNGLVNKLTRMMDHPFALTQKSKDWYEESGKAIRDITRGDPVLMDRVARLMALYSQGNSVGGNTTALVKSMYQIARGEESIQAGRFPETTAAVIPELLAAPEFDQSVKGVSDKIENFYRNLIDPARGTDSYDQASTMDKWMMRLFGYKVADDEEVGGSANLTSTQYRYARDLLNRVGDSWERKTGERLKPRQIQAVLWTYKKNLDAFNDAKAEGKVSKQEDFTPTDKNFNDYLIRSTANVAWETRPSESLPIIPFIHSASRQVQNKLNWKIWDVLHEPDKTDRVMNLLTTGQLYNGNVSSGGYEGRAVPNVITRLVLEKDADNRYVYSTANQYSALLGYILKQDAVAWFKPVPDSEATADSSVGYHIEFSKRLTPEQEQQFQQDLNDKVNLLDRTYTKKQREAGVPEAVEAIPEQLGFTRVGDGYFVVNFRTGSDAQRTLDNEFEKILNNVMAKVPVDSVIKFEKVRVDSGYISNDWKENPNGEGYQDVFGPAGFGDLQSSVDSLAAEVAEATREFGREYGGYGAGRRYDAPSERKTLRTPRDFIPRSTEQGQLSVRDYPTYVTGRQGPESGRAEFVGYHYSNVNELPTLDSQFHGTGRAGDEMERPPIPRVMFYEQVDETLPYPEIELGGSSHGYGVKLNNIYDRRKDDFIPKAIDEMGIIGVQNRMTMFEQLVMDNGYDGYYNPNDNSSVEPTITVLGEAQVPVRQTMRDRNRVSAIAESDTDTIKYSTITPTADFGAFTNEVLSNEVPTGPFTDVFRKIAGAAPGESLKKALLRNVVNRFLPAYELDERAYGTSFDNADSVGRSMELSQQLVGRMQGIMEIGPIQIDRDGNITQVENAEVGGINSIFRPLFDGMNKQDANEQERLFFAYAIARREKALRAKGRRGFVNKTIQEIDEIIRRAPPLYENVFDNFQKFNEYTIQLGVDSGVLNNQMAANLRDMAYIPFYREFGMDQEQDYGDALPRRAANTLNNPVAFDKRLVGSEKKLQADLFENIFRNQQAILSAALKNIAMQKTAKAIDQLNRMGQTDIGNRVEVKESGPQIARFRINGEEVAYQIKDGAMWKAIAGLTPPQKQGFIKAAEAFANLLRFGVTNMPGFMLANLWRGKVDAYVKLGNPMLRLDQTMKGMAQVYNSGPDAMAIKLLTGFGGYGYGADPSDFATTARRNIRTQGKIFNNQGFLDGLQNLKQQMERIGESTEMGERVVIYERMIQDGYSPREAAFQAMNLINYGRRGAGGGILGGLIVHALIPSIPFLNARIQGLYRLVESQDASPEAKRRAWMGIMTRGMMLTMASMLMYSTTMDEDDWENQTMENKINYDYIYYDEGKAIKLPRAFEIGSLFGTLPVMLMETIRKEDGSDLVKATIMTFANTFSFNPVPQIAMPTLEVMTGYDFFRGAPIEGGALQNKLVEERYYDSTPYMYRWLSRNGGALINLSPVEIQQLMEGYLAGFGGLIAGTGDTIMAASGLVPQDPNGVFGDPYVTRLARVAGLNRFVSMDGEGSSRFVRDFYDIKREVDQYHRAVQDAAQRGDTERVQDLMAEKGAAMSLRKAFNSVAQQITQINNAIAMVSQSSTMNPAEKTERLRALRLQKNELTKRFVNMAKSTGYF